MVGSRNVLAMLMQACDDGVVASCGSSSAQPRVRRRRTGDRGLEFLGLSGLQEPVPGFTGLAVPHVVFAAFPPGVRDAEPPPSSSAPPPTAGGSAPW
jgi:hypothetical protein